MSSSRAKVEAKSRILGYDWYILMITWQWYKFNELRLEQLYDVMALRVAIFTHEQHCTADDLDGLDKQALHLLGLQNNMIVAYARVLPKGVYYQDAISFGRLVIPKKHRGKGLGWRPLP